MFWENCKGGDKDTVLRFNQTWGTIYVQKFMGIKKHTQNTL